MHYQGSFTNTVQTLVKNNSLKLIVRKTKYMIFTYRSPEDINISIEAQRLMKSEHERLAGFIIDSKLSWSHHNKQLKISRNAGVMIKLKSSIPNKAQKILYNTII